MRSFPGPQLTVPTAALALVFALVAVVSPALSQPAEQDVEAMMQEASSAFDAVIEFVKDVHFNEKDIQSLLEHREEFDALKNESELAVEEGKTIDLQQALTIPAYVAFTRKYGLDRDTWLKKALRIQVMLSRDEMQAGMAGGDEKLAAQMEQMEGMREQLGEEMYQQMVDGMKAAMAGMESMQASMAKLPPPTEEEAKLLAKYEEQLKAME